MVQSMEILAVPVSGSGSWESEVTTEEVVPNLNPKHIQADTTERPRASSSGPKLAINPNQCAPLCRQTHLCVALNPNGRCPRVALRKTSVPPKPVEANPAPPKAEGTSRARAAGPQIFLGCFIVTNRPTRSYCENDF